MIVKLELLPCNLETLLWFVLMVLWASRRSRTGGKTEVSLLSQLEDWPVYKVKCPTSDARQKPKYQILHRNCLLLVTDEDASSIPGQVQAKVNPIVLNATPEAFSEGTGLLEKLLPSLVTRQGGDMTSQVWLNGKFHMKPWTQTVPEATQSPPDLIGDEVSEPESEFSDSVPEGM